jgi:hypothetical protein
MEAKIVFKNESQNYVLCPYCDQIHIHHMDFGTVDRPANCPEGQDGELTYMIKARYSLKDIAQALASRDQMIIRKRAIRAKTKTPAETGRPA